MLYKNKSNNFRVFKTISSFIEYQKNIELNEAIGNNELTVDSMLEFIEKIIKKQKDIAKKSSSMKKILNSNKEVDQAIKTYLTSLANKKNLDLKDYIKYVKKSKSLSRGIEARISVIGWELITYEQKRNLAIKLLGQAGQKNIKNLNQLNKFLNKKTKISDLPLIGMKPDFMEEKINIETIPSEFSLFKSDIVKLFKDNKYKLEDDSFEREEDKEELIENIFNFLNEVIRKTFKIESITIYSSSSRYRNTGEENISWGELSYQRSFTLAKMILEVAKELKLGKDKVEEIRNKILLDFYGDNGDGTSGPNPPEGIRFGYYNDKGFQEGKERNEVILYEIDEEGKPLRERKSIQLDPLNSEKDYDEFKYVDIIIKGYHEREEKSDVDKVEIDGYSLTGMLPTLTKNPPKDPPSKTNAPTKTKKYKNRKVNVNPVKCAAYN